MKEGLIRSSFEAAHAARFEHLNRLRRFAALSKPWLLPPEGHDSLTQALPSTYQSIVARGLTSLEGQTLASLYSPTDPWFIQTQADEIAMDPNVDPEIYEENERFLLARSMIAYARLEGTHGASDNHDALGFRTAKRQVLANVFALGDALDRMNDDYSVQCFNILNYTTCRDSSGRVLNHIVKETIDPLSLSHEAFEAAGLKESDFEDKCGLQRMVDSYTMVEWNPRTNVWTECQEINKREVRCSEEKVTRYFSTPFELAAGDHYGHGFVELHHGDIHSLDALSERILDFAVAASKLHPVIDTGSDMAEEDLASRTLTVLRGRVQGGVVQDIGFVQTNKLQDFQIVQNVRDSLRQDLGGAMLVGSQSVRNSERTTATEVMQVNIRELDGALGGFYAPIADRQQRPTVDRLFYQCERDRLFLPIKQKKAIKTKVLTGIAALANVEKLQRVTQATNIVAQLGPEAIRHIDMGCLVNIIMRYSRVAEPGLVKSKKQLEAEMQQAMAQATQAAAAQQAIQTTGNVVEQQAAQTQ